MYLTVLTINTFNKLFIALCVFFCTGGVFALDSKNEGVLLNKQIQNTLKKDRIKYELPALSVGIKLPEEDNPRNYIIGYYYLSGKKKITSDTLFQIGSITKTFTASIIFKLIEEYQLNLNDELTRWLPQYPRWKNVTVNDLLRHTSGVSNYSHGKEFDSVLRSNPNKYFSLSELANLAYDQGDISRPGKKYNYTNTDYILLGMISEKVTKKSLQQIFDNYLHQYHLTNTFYTPSGYPHHIINKIAHGYDRGGTFKFNEDVTFVSTSSGQSAGAIISTPNDLIKWLNQLFAGKIITNKSLTNMMSVISEIDAKPIDLLNIHLSNELLKQKKSFTEVGAGRGMGLLYFKNYGFAWVHAGGVPGYESFYAYNPCTGIYLVLMYSVKPKQQLTFIKIADDIFNTLNKSELVNNYVKLYQHNNVLPAYC